MTEHIVVITGANRGLGRQTALDLAISQSTVVMACRDLTAAEPVRAAIQEASGNNRVHLMQLDLGNLQSIARFAEEFKTRFGRLNVLINNAGITSRHPQKTVDGFEAVVGTNYLGPYYLTKLLLPCFGTDGDRRIINMTSNIYPFGRFSFAKLNSYTWTKAYAVSKYLILLYTLEMADALKVRGITVNAVDPGVVKTALMFTRQWYDAIINFILLPFYVSVENGAATAVRLATAPELAETSGERFYKGKIKRLPWFFRHDPLRRELLARTEDLLRAALVPKKP